MNFVALLLGTALGGCDQHRCTPNSNWDCDTHDVDVAQSSCDADTNCTWVWMLGCDGGAQCCFPKDACIVNPSMSSCMSDPKCNWQEGAYRVNDMRFCAEDPKPCYKYTSKCECRADRSCEWDANNSSCGWIRRKVGTCTDSCDCYHKDECFKNDTCSFVNFARGGDAGKQEDWGCKELHDGTQHPCFRYIYGSQYCNKDTRCQWDYSDPTIKGGRCRARGRAYPDSEHNVTGCEQYEEKQHCEDPTLSPGLNLTCEWVMYKGCRNATAPHTPTPVDSDACALHLSNISSCLSDQKCVYLRKPPTAKDYGFPCQELPDRQVCYKITDECQCGGDLCEWKAESCVRREVCNVCECNVDYRQCWQNDTCDFPAGSGGACGVRDGTKHPCLRYGKEEDACKMDDRCFWALDDTDRSEGCSAWNVLDPLVRFSSSSVRECHNHDFMNSCQANATCEWVMYKGCRVNKDTVVTTSPTLAPTVESSQQPSFGTRPPSRGPSALSTSGPTGARPSSPSQGPSASSTSWPTGARPLSTPSPSQGPSLPSTSGPTLSPSNGSTVLCSPEDGCQGCVEDGCTAVSGKCLAGGGGSSRECTRSAADAETTDSNDKGLPAWIVVLLVVAGILISGVIGAVVKRNRRRPPAVEKEKEVAELVSSTNAAFQQYDAADPSQSAQPVRV
eukprot:Hpha_TRINITY_DN13195_c0_g1::TRINITY_DN13195_c0_g1_i3::g.113623::m.113623